MSNNLSFDQSIPVLTEVFSDQPLNQPLAKPLDQPLVQPALPVQDDANASLEARAVDSWTEPEWNLLERRLSERILQQLQGRVDFVLEQRLRDSMEEVLQNTITGLTREIRLGLQDTIEKIVVRAVAQELAHLQTLKK
jgi:hypothetical protein